MIIYSHRRCPYDPAQAAAALHAAARAAGRSVRPSYDLLVDLLIRSGELESAIVDALCPIRDDILPVGELLRVATTTIATAFVAWRAEDDRHCGESICAFAEQLESIRSQQLPATAVAGVQEGYALFEVRPERYAAAAHECYRRMRPARVTCLGVRAIGASLSAVVAGTLHANGAEVRSVTVRPHGDPTNRTLVITDAMAAWVRRWDDQHIAIVDEGPGLSGSTITAVASAMMTIGVPASRIVLFPSWCGRPEQFTSSQARQLWPQLTSFPADAHAGTEAATVHHQHRDAIDISAGGWRQRLPGMRDTGPCLAVNPQHERRKYFLADRRRVLRFAGLGEYGRSALRRAEALAAGGYGAPPGALNGGFLLQAFIPGRPAARSDVSAHLLDRLARYLAWLRITQQTPISANPASLLEMACRNTAEGTGITADPLIDGMMSSLPHDEPAIAVDGRMLPHEWIVSGNSFFKTDAIDHHRDDFFPGEHDIAWDVAGAMVEFDLDVAAQSSLLDRYRQYARDDRIDHRLPFYRLAYLAYRLGYVSVSADMLRGTDEEPRFASLKARYAARLHEALARAGFTASPSGR